MVSLINKQMIIIKHLSGATNREIARQLHLDRGTVNKYVNEYQQSLRELECGGAIVTSKINEAPRYDTSNRDLHETTKRATIIIEQCLEENARKRQTGRHKQQMRITDIHEHLMDLGFDISYSTVRRVARAIEEKPQEAYIHQEHPLAYETEFDWGTVKLDIGGAGYFKYQIAVFTSAYGNHRFAKVYRNQDTAAFQEAHADYFAFCHGVYKHVVYDNMRVAVKQFVGPSEKEPTDALVELSLYYGFQFRFCNVRRGNEKGHVERSVDRVRHYAFSKPEKDKFDTLDEANIYLKDMIRKLNKRPLSDGRIPEHLFLDELPHLMAEKPKMPCFIKIPAIKVDKYSTAIANKVHYSVPDNLVGKIVEARVYTGIVELYYDGQQVAKHERHYRQGEYILDIYHYLHTFMRKNGALPRSTALAQADTTIKKIYEKYYITEPKEFLLVLEIIQEIGVIEVENALNILSQKTTKDYSASKIRVILNTLENVNEQPSRNGYKIDRLSRKAKETLPQYDLLREIQSRRAV